MTGPGPNTLTRRYEDLVLDICASVERGQPPWWNATAGQGPAILGRSGQSLRGLPAIIAWHVGEGSPGRPLAWRLMPPSQIDVGTAAVFRLAANGGDALYAAIPDRRPQETQDSPTRDHLAYWPLERLDERLAAIANRLGTMAPDLDEERTAILSLAQAFLRPLGYPAEPTRTPLCTGWTPRRLARVAAWARLVADDVGLDVFMPRRGRYSATARWHRSSRWTVYNAQDLMHLRRVAWLQHCLPAEVRDRPTPQSQEVDGRHLAPEQPLRPGLFRQIGRARGPALSGLILRLGSSLSPSQHLPWAMHVMNWGDKAALGLSLAESLGLDMLPSEPGLAWRLIGRRARAAVQAQAPVSALNSAFFASDVRGYWEDLKQHHALRTWFHPTTKARLEALVATKRWTKEDLDTLLRQQELPGWSEGGSELPVTALPVVRVATLRRSKKTEQVDEPAVRMAIATALGCDDSWAAVTAAVGRATWERHKRAKRSGGVRWLDVPCEPLRAAQRVVSDVLFSVAPAQATPTAFHPGASPALHARAHAGALAAVRMDLADFFGSVRPWHLEPWLGLATGKGRNLLRGWSRKGRESLMSLLFRRRPGAPPYLPQGAPGSPAAANLAAAWLDHAIIHRAVGAFGAGAFTYTRYADDMVVSTREPGLVGEFTRQACALLVDAVAGQRWRVQPSKTRVWTHRDREPLHICDLRVPGDPRLPLTLGRDTWRRARAALHRMRHRVDFDVGAAQGYSAAHGLLAYAYSATADVRWLAYTSVRLQHFARRFAGPLFSESFLAGWSDMEAVASERGDALP